MATIEMRLISEILRLQSMTEVLKSGFRQEYIKDPDALMVYKYLENHYNSPETRKLFPPIEEIKRRFPYFDAVDVKEDIRSLLNSLQSRSMSSDVVALARKFAEIAEHDQDGALRLMVAHLPELTRKYKRSAGFGLSEIMDNFEKAYAGARDGTSWGVPWPWQVLTNDTMGKNRGDFVVFYGRPKSLKTWLLYHCAVTDYQKYNQRVLIWSREMDPRKNQLRLGSLLGKVDYQLLKKGRLPENLYNRARNTIKDLMEAQVSMSEEEIKDRGERSMRDLIVLSGPGAPKTTTDLKASIEMYQPEAVYLDSFYHLSSDRAGKTSQEWSKIQYVAEDIKGMALDYNIFIGGAAQANRSGEKLLGDNLSEMAGSDSIGREADLVMRVIKQKRGYRLNENDYEGRGSYPKGVRRPAVTLGRPGEVTPDSPEEAPERTGTKVAVILPGNREGTLEAFTIFAVPGYNFEVDQEQFSPGTVEKWVKEDVAAESVDAKKTRGGTVDPNEDHVQEKREPPKGGIKWGSVFSNVGASK